MKYSFHRICGLVLAFAIATPLSGVMAQETDLEDDEPAAESQVTPETPPATPTPEEDSSPSDESTDDAAVPDNDDEDESSKDPAVTKEVDPAQDDASDPEAIDPEDGSPTATTETETSTDDPAADEQQRQRDRANQNRANRDRADQNRSNQNRNQPSRSSDAERDRDDPAADRRGDSVENDRNRSRTTEQRQSRERDGDDRVGENDQRRGNRDGTRRAIRDIEDLGVRISGTSSDGLTITRIEQNSLLRRSGLRRGDVLVSVRGRPLRSQTELVRWYSSLEPGIRMPIIVLRDGQRETLYLSRVDNEQWMEHSGDDQLADQPGGDIPYLGVVFDDRYTNVARVEDVQPDTTAERAGLEPGDVIEAINGQRVRGFQQVANLIRQMEPGEEIEIEFSRRIEERATAMLGSRPNVEQTTYLDESGSRDWQEDDGEYSETRRSRTTRGVEGSSDDPFDTTETYSEEIEIDDVRVDSPRDNVRETLRPLRRGTVRPFRNP